MNPIGTFSMEKRDLDKNALPQCEDEEGECFNSCEKSTCSFLFLLLLENASQGAELPCRRPRTD